MNDRSSRLVWMFLSYDVVIIIVSFLGSIYLKLDSFGPGKYVLFLPLFILSWIMLVLAFTSQNYAFREGLFQRVRNQLVDFMLFVGAVSALILILNLKLYSRMVLFGTILIFFFLRNVGFVVIHHYLSYMRAHGRHVKRVLIIGAGRIGSQLSEYLNQDVSAGYVIVGYLDDSPDKALIDKRLILGSCADIDKVLSSHSVEEIILAIPLTETEKLTTAIERAEFFGLRVSMVPDYYRLLDRPFETSYLGPLPVINIREIALDKMVNKGIKRTFDMVFSACVLILLSPMLLTIGILVKIGSKGPMLYRPERVGIGGRRFKCWKFRSMYMEDDPDHASKSTSKNDPRITPLGAVLRKYSLDELPQFFNVLFGKMSVVGPRPHRTFLDADMQKKVHGYMLRHYIKPGITGWAQVNGWRGPTETIQQRSERTNHDLWYIDHWTLWLDVKIVLMTLFRSSKNAY